MIYVGIDVAKNKHDCCILGSSGTVLREAFTLRNDRKGFQELYSAIQEALHQEGTDQIKTGEVNGFSDDLLSNTL